MSEIVPVEAARSERGLERAAHKRVERWRRIALEASQQSRRAFLPEIGEPVDLREALSRRAEHRYAMDEDPAAAPLDVSAPGDVAILIGPEGGWTDEEREQLVGAGWTPVSLGPLILRAETAAIAALAVIGARQALH